MPIQLDIAPTADPALLRQQAHDLQAIADDLESASGQYARGASHTQWRGQAASEFEQYLRAYSGSVRSQAGQLRAIAAAMLKGASDIEKYRASIAKLRADLAHRQTALN